METTDDHAVNNAEVFPTLTNVKRVARKLNTATVLTADNSLDYQEYQGAVIIDRSQP